MSYVGQIVHVVNGRKHPCIPGIIKAVLPVSEINPDADKMDTVQIGHCYLEPEDSYDGIYDHSADKPYGGTWHTVDECWRDDTMREKKP